MEPIGRDILIPHFSERFRHDWWANATLLEFFEDHDAFRSGSPSAAGGASRALHLFGHLLATELLWLGRVCETDDRALPVWRARSFAEICELYETSRRKWERFLGRLQPDQLSQRFRYTNVAGERYENTLIQVVAHVLNHSTHHRAQILWAIRQHGLEPPGLDYIVFLRSK